MAEELPNPKKDLPRAIAAQIGLGAISTVSRPPAAYILLTSFSRFLFWHRTLLRHQRSRRSHQFARCLSTCCSICASDGINRRNFWPPLHHFPLTYTLSHWNVPHSGSNLVGSRTRQCNTFPTFLRKGQRDSQLPNSSNSLHRDHDDSIRCHHGWLENSIFRFGWFFRGA